MHLFCFGLGYSAQTLARRLAGEGWHIAGTVRSADKAQALRAGGLDALCFEDRAAVTRALDGASHVLVSTPPADGTDPVLEAYRPAMAAFAQRRDGWIGYLSTTGVYGDRGGDWVDETTPLAPASDRAKARAAAEAAWHDVCAGAPPHIFRLPGIYGPGRSAIDTLRAGTARRIDRPGQVFSRIHVDDIAGAVHAAIRAPHPGIYNLCDDEPAPQHQVIAYAAALLGMTPPPLQAFAEAAKSMSAMAQSFYGESRRVSNARIKRIFAWAPAFPSYREGLKAIMARA